MLRRRLLIAAATLLSFGLAAGGLAPAHASVVTPDLNSGRASVLRATNQQRAAVGAGELAEDSRLDSIAQAWAQVMADQVTLWHNPCFNPQVMTMTDSGGENIAMGAAYDDTTVVSVLWHNSSGHYANMIDPDFTHIGIGKAYTPEGRPFWVQDFSAALTAPDLDSFPAIREQCQKDIQDVYNETGTSPQPATSTFPPLAPKPSQPAEPTQNPTPWPTVPTQPQPSAPTTPKLKKPGSVSAVKATHATSTSVTISWAKPKTKSNKPVFYNVRIYLHGKLMWANYTGAKHTSLKMKHLFRGQKYTARVSAQNAAGASKWSKAITFRTKR